jgi:multiple sugar transport system permease protein
MRTKNFISHLVLLSLSACALVPFIGMLSTSLKSSEQIYHSGFELIPNPVEWGNYLVALNKIGFLGCALNTLYIAVFSVVGVTISSALAAYAFSALNWRGREIVFAVTIATMMLPDMALLVPQFLLIKWLGLYGSSLALIMPYLGGLPFYIFLLRQFFLSIPRELADSARIDGATEWQIFAEIYMPLAKPALMVVALFQFMINWNDLMKPSVYLIDEARYTLSLGLQQYQSQLGGAEWGPMMAAAIIVIIPVLVLFLFTQKQFIQGITMSGLKDG